MNTGAFGENFPYTNFHDLNLDWILKEMKNFLDHYSEINQNIDNGLGSLTDKTNEGLDSLTDKTNEGNESITQNTESQLDTLNDWYHLHYTLLENLIDSVQRRSHNVILISDSYGTRQNSQGKTWFEVFRDMTNCTLMASVAYPGGGFYQGNLLTAFQNIESTIKYPETVTDIIIACGANDITYDYQGIRSGISDFATYCKTQYPNAKIYLAHIGIIFDSEKMTDRYNKSLRAYRDCIFYGMLYIGNSEYILKDSDLITNTDNTHPSLEGVSEIGRQLANMFLTGNGTVCYTKLPTMNSQTSAISGLSSFFTQTMTNNVVVMHPLDDDHRYLVINWANPIANTDTQLQGGYIANIAPTIIIGATSKGCIKRCLFKHTTATGTSYEYGYLKILTTSAGITWIFLISEAHTTISGITQTTVYGDDWIGQSDIV